MSVNNKIANAPTVHSSNISLHLSPDILAFLQHERATAPASSVVALGLAKLFGLHAVWSLKNSLRNPQSRLMLLLLLIDWLCQYFTEERATLLMGSDAMALDISEKKIRADECRACFDYGISASLLGQVMGRRHDLSK